MASTFEKDECLLLNFRLIFFKNICILQINSQSREAPIMSIKKDQLIQFIEKPGLLNEQTIGELKEIVEEFPYFQTGQLLYTYNLYSQANFRYEGYLKTCSIHATDRTILYHLLQQQPPTEKSLTGAVPPDKKIRETSAVFELAEEKQITETELPSRPAPQPNETELIDFDLLSFDQTDENFASDDNTTDLLTLEVVGQSEPVEPKASEKIDLIDQFIKENPVIQPRKVVVPERNELPNAKEEPEIENDEFITETLSRIYLKQGHYQKAIDSFKRLSLKFPEKSVYFAEQIEEIKKLLN